MLRGLSTGIMCLLLGGCYQSQVTQLSSEIAEFKAYADKEQDRQDNALDALRAKLEDELKELRALCKDLQSQLKSRDAALDKLLADCANMKKQFQSADQNIRKDQNKNTRELLKLAHQLENLVKDMGGLTRRLKSQNELVRQIQENRLRLDKLTRKAAPASKPK